MKYKILKPIIIILLILSVSVFLWNSFELFIAGFVRENYAITINDNNREKIASLLEKNTDCYEEIPPLDQAVKIEYIVLMHKDRITVHYADETTYVFFIKDAYKNPVTLYIKDEGCSVYFTSPESLEDIINACIPLALSVILVVLLIIGKRKGKENPGFVQSDF